MTLAVFPLMRGLSFDLQMTPRFNTGVSSSANGHETRIVFQAYPLWDYELSYSWLPNVEAGRSDLKKILNFFLDRKGSFESFLFQAPETPYEKLTLLGTGDGTNRSFPLLTTRGSSFEPSGGIGLKSHAEIYLDTDRMAVVDFELIDHREILFDTAPAAGKEVRGTYLPLDRVRFTEDSADFNQFAARLWELQSLSLKGIFS